MENSPDSNCTGRTVKNDGIRGKSIKNARPVAGHIHFFHFIHIIILLLSNFLFAIYNLFFLVYNVVRTKEKRRNRHV